MAQRIRGRVSLTPLMDEVACLQVSSFFST
jgi:hypothetical protein